jgi:hypothetical protein
MCQNLTEPDAADFLARHVDDLYSRPLPGGAPELSLKWRMTGELLALARFNSPVLPFAGLNLALAEYPGTEPLRDLAMRLNAELPVPVWGFGAERGGAGEPAMKIYAGGLHEFPSKRVWAALMKLAEFRAHLPESASGLGGMLSAVGLTFRREIATEAKVYSHFGKRVQNMTRTGECEIQTEWLSGLTTRWRIPHRGTWIERRYRHACLDTAAVAIEISRAVADPFTAWRLPAAESLRRCADALRVRSYYLRYLGVWSDGDEEPILAGYWHAGPRLVGRPAGGNSALP